MLSVKSLVAVLEIAKAGSISQAAQNMYTTQPYLSKILKEVESETMVTLFTRTHNGMTPTADGKLFLKYANQIMDLFAEIDCLKTLHKPLHLRIGATPSLVIQESFSMFYKLHPDWDMSFNELEMDQIIQQLSDDSLDIGIVLVDFFRKNQLTSIFKSMNLTFIPLYHDSLCAVVGKANPLFEKKSILFSELSASSFASTKYCPYSPAFFDDTNIELAPLSFETNNMCFHYISNSNCFTFGLPIFNIGNHLLLTNQIKFLKISDKPLDVTIGCLLKQTQLESDVLVKSYVDFLISYWNTLHEKYVTNVE